MGSTTKTGKSVDRMFKATSGALAITFGVVGLVFLLFPEEVLTIFNNLSPTFGFSTLHPPGSGFFLVLAVAYMYLVTTLAWLMYRHPANPTFPFLLLHAKAASALLSVALFILGNHFLILLVNGIVDGAIAIVASLMVRQARRATE